MGNSPVPLIVTGAGVWTQEVSRGSTKLNIKGLTVVVIESSVVLIVRVSVTVAVVVVGCGCVIVLTQG